jgi:hypothetical protein
MFSVGYERKPKKLDDLKITTQADGVLCEVQVDAEK